MNDRGGIARARGFCALGQEDGNEVSTYARRAGHKHMRKSFDCCIKMNGTRHRRKRHMHASAFPFNDIS